MKVASSILLVSSLALSTVHGQAATANNPDDAAGKVLYVTSPACGSYECSVNWYQGSTVNINWLMAPAGSVSISLITHLLNGGTDYVVSASTPAVTTSCDAGGGPGVQLPGKTCGGAYFVVPSGWKAALNYSIQVTSLSDPTIIGYTDLVSVLVSNSTASAGPTGTVASLIGGSTSAAIVATSATALRPLSSGSMTIMTTAPSSIAAAAASITPANSAPASTTSTVKAAGAAGASGMSLACLAFGGLALLL